MRVTKGPSGKIGTWGGVAHPTLVKAWIAQPQSLRAWVFQQTGFWMGLSRAVEPGLEMAATECGCLGSAWVGAGTHPHPHKHAAGLEKMQTPDKVHRTGSVTVA